MIVKGRTRCSKDLTSARREDLSTAQLANQATAEEVSSEIELLRDAAAEPARIVLTVGICRGAFAGRGQLEIIYTIIARRSSGIKIAC